MRTAAFAYSAPTSVEDALAALGDGGTVLAGGQGLVQAMKLGAREPEHLVDVNGVAGLDGIAEDADGLRIGALVRVRELLVADPVARCAPALARAARLLGDVQVRNRATLGGNLCLADPRANLSPALISLRAQAHVASADGERALPVAELFEGFRANALAAGELLTAVTIPHRSGEVHGTYREFARQRNSVPIVNVAVTRADGDVGVAVGGLATRPLPLPAVESALRDGGVEAAVAALDRDGVAPYEDIHGSAGYRLRLARVLLRRALEDLNGGQDG